MSTELIGRTLRGYELIAELGEGGFGAVYRARQNVVGREVAVKVILPQHANHPTFVRRFEAEAQFIAQLEHPHIVPLFDYWRDPEGAYLVMRYIKGGSLRQRLSDGPFDLEATARFLDQIAGALSIAHRANVVHLDLKPDNILFDADGNAYLTDFGIAKAVGVRDDSEESISGTLAYAAPEQIQGAAPSPQFDIYSLGTILFEVLTGRHPFHNVEVNQLLIKHLTEDLPPLDEYRPDLPSAIDTIIQTATAKDPLQRYTDVRELAEAFRKQVEKSNSNYQTDEILIDLAGATNPYKGLRPFNEADAANFYGREPVIAQMAARMGDTNFLAVVGPSGSGKSSLVKAGLIPALRGGAYPGSENWYMAEFVPGSTPVANLASALNSIATRPSPRLLETLMAVEDALGFMVKDLLADDPNSHVLLVIDQFEEVFTQVEDEGRRRHFLELLRRAVVDADSQMHVIITLRADFYDRPLQYPGFGALVQAHTQVLLPLSVQELERAIIGPVEPLGISVDADLIATMIADVREQPGALPLLQYALTEVFERRDGPRLTLETYRDTGGVSGALAKRAEDVFSTLGRRQREAAQQIFLRLITLGEGQEDTRRRAPYSELVTLGDPDTIQAVLDTFGQVRLLTFDTDPETREPLIEVAHEALLRSWQRLRDWMNENRDDIRQQRLLAHAAEEWLKADRDTSFLLRGARLEQVSEWEQDTRLQLTTDERAFLDASLQEHSRQLAEERERAERERQLEERARNRLRQIVTVLTVATVIGVSLTVLAVINARTAREQANIAATAEQRALTQADIAATAEQRALNQADIAATAEQRALTQADIAEEEARRAQSLALSTAAQLALLRSERDTAVALAMEANRQLDDPPLPAQLVLAQLAYSPGTIRRLMLDSPVSAAAMNADGSLLVTGTRSGELQIWDVADGSHRDLPGHLDRISGVAVSGDGSMVISASWDDTAIVWDADSGEALHILSGHNDNLLAVALSPDGQLALTGANDNTAILWNTQTGRRMMTLDGFEAPVTSVAFSPDGTRLLAGSADDTAQEWRISGSTVQRYITHRDRINAVAFSPRGDLRLTASNDESVRLYDEQSRLLRILNGHDDRVTAATFSGDGRYAVSGGRDGTVIVWDVNTGEARYTLTEHEDTILSIAADATGRTVATASEDGTVRVWEIGADAPLARLDGFPGTQARVAVSPDGETWLRGAVDGGARLYNSPATRIDLLGLLAVAPRSVISAAYSPDGRYVVTGRTNNTAELFDLSRMRRTHVLRGHTGDVSAVAFTPDSRRVISAASDATMLVHDVETGDLVRTFARTHEDGILSVTVSPNGETVVSGSNDGSIVLWDIESGQEMRRVLGINSAVNDLAFSPDGGTFFAALGEGTIREWQTADGREVRTFTGHRADVLSLALSDDGRTMATAGADNSLIVWDVASGAAIVQLVAPPQITLDMFPAGQLALGAAQDGSVLLWRTLPLGELFDWTAANRYVPELTCQQRELYNIPPLC